MKRRYKLFYPLCFLVLFIFNSCEKFLKLEQDGDYTREEVPVSTLEDFEEVLNGSSFIKSNYLLPDIMSDDVELSDNLVNTSPERAMMSAYLWSKDFFEIGESDVMYSSAYAKIFKYNLILKELALLSGVDESKRNNLIAEVKVQRAWEYFQLVNTYAKVYDKSTSASDLGVPFVLTNLEVKPSRATIAQVYDQILADLNSAIAVESYPYEGKNIAHPGKLAAYALLSRVYLFMGNYKLAYDNAELVLKVKNTILDYKNSSVSFPRNLSSIESDKTEVLFQKYFEHTTLYNTFSSALPFVSLSLQNLYGTKDLRLTLKTSLVNSKYMLKVSGTAFLLDYGINVPEMYLIKAEYLARDNRNDEALQILNDLRRYRFKEADYKELDASYQGGVLQAVFDERRRELFMRGGIRLFDLKRLQRDNLNTISIERQSTVKVDSVIAILPPKSNRYIVPFSYSLMNANPNIIQNER